MPIQPVASDCSSTRAVGAALAAVDDGDVVQPEEAALEDVVPLAVDLVDPPGEVDQQLVEAALEEVAVGLARADPVHVVDPPDRPGVDRRVEVGELPLVGRDLAVGVLELLEEQDPELLLGELAGRPGRRRRSGTPGPRRRTRGTPTCRAWSSPASSSGAASAGCGSSAREAGGGQVGVVAVEPDVDVEEVALLGPEQPGERLALDRAARRRLLRRVDRLVELVGLRASQLR